MTKTATNEYKAVLISDIHYNVHNRELCNKALVDAASRSINLQVPLIIAGDLLDNKALIRAECANDIIKLLSSVPEDIQVYILAGNHDLISEKSSENSLNFLKPYAHVVRAPVYVNSLALWMIPYCNDSEKLRNDLSSLVPKDSTIIMHQGVQGAHMGDYVIDKTSLPKEVFADYRVISGHYHRHQDIKCGRSRRGAVGLFTYIGSPFTHTFAEANDGPKGYQLLRKDGLLEQVPLDLRRHVIVEQDITHQDFKIPAVKYKPDDLLWLKIKGPSLELKKLKKDELGKFFIGHSNFKLDLIPTDTTRLEPEDKPKTNDELMDALIDTSPELPASKEFLKQLWREIV